MVKTKNIRFNLRWRFLLLMLLTGLLSFAALAAVAVIGMSRMREGAMASGQRMENAAADFTESLAIDFAKSQLAITAKEDSRRVSQELSNFRDNLQHIDHTVERILADPDRYGSRQLPEITDTAALGSGKCYILYPRAAENNPEAAAMRREAAILSNIADTMENICGYYSAYSVTMHLASERGYMIALENAPEDDRTEFVKSVRERRLLSDYDPRTRIWYEAGKKAKSIAENVGFSSRGEPVLFYACPYAVDGEFAGVVSLNIDVDSLYRAISDKAVGYDKMNFAMRSDGRVIFSSETKGSLAVTKEPADLRASPEPSLAEAAAKMAKGENGVASVAVNGEEYFLAYSYMPAIQCSYGTLRKKSEALAPVLGVREEMIRRTVDLTDAIHASFLESFREMAWLLFAILVILFFASEAAAKFFVRPILALADGVRAIAKGNWDVPLAVTSVNEMGILASSVNHMARELRKYADSIAKAAAEKERIATELSLAKNIQAGMLPQIAPAFSNDPSFDLSASITPAREVGGDFYDVYRLDEHRLALTMADVSGKGVPSALFMVITKTVLRNIALAPGGEAGCAEVLERANRALCGDNKERLSVTAVFGILDTRTGTFRYANAGHCSPLLWRAGSESAAWQSADSGADFPALAATENAKYEEKRLSLSPGDALFLYTDGVTEAMNAPGGTDAEERLREILRREMRSGGSMEAVLAAVRAEAEASGAALTDDITMLGVRFFGA